MDTIEQVLRNVIGKEETRTFNSYELLDVCTLKKEIINYNKKLHNIIKSNKIYFNNEVSFMLQIKKQNSNKELLPIVICFLCDKKYIDKFKYEKLSPLVNGDIAAYVLLKTNIEKFFDKLRYIESREKREIKKDYYEDGIRNLETLVEETYEKCNCININRRDKNLEKLVSEDEKYIINFIQDNINRKNIDYKIYMKKLADRKEEASAYLAEVVKKLLKFNEDGFIKEVEHVKEFYNSLEEILEEEIEKEFEAIISYFLQNTIFND